MTAKEKEIVIEGENIELPDGVGECPTLNERSEVGWG